MALIIHLIGCSDESDTEANGVLGPDPENAGSTWEISTSSTSGEEIYYARVQVSLHNSEDPQISLARSHGPGSLADLATMSMEDFNAYWEMAVEIVGDQAENADGCDAEEGQSESVSWFSGDSHDGASISGCVAPRIEEFREMNSELVEKYFSEEL